MVDAQENPIIEQWNKIRDDGNAILGEIKAGKRTDWWPTDGINGADLYKDKPLQLLDPGLKSYEEWAEKRQAQGHATHVLDFCGGAYVFDDLSHVDSITGVRLSNIDSVLEKYYTENDELEYLSRLKQIASNPK